MLKFIFFPLTGNLGPAFAVTALGRTHWTGVCQSVTVNSGL